MLALSIPFGRRRYMDVGAVLGAVGTLAVTVGGAIGIWWVRILNKRHNNELERLDAERRLKREDEAATRRGRKDSLDELREAMEATKLQLGESREEIHDLKNRVGVSENKEAACQIRLARIETLLAETQGKLEETLLYVEDLETTLVKANVPIVRRRRRPDHGSHKPAPPTGDNDG